MHAYLEKRESDRVGKKKDTAQRKGGAAQGKEGVVQRKSGVTERAGAAAENRTGIPTRLKERMEQHTGLSLDDVRVHYHSDMPKRLDALAYTQGNQVYLGSGQERHLPHELGHVVQQKLGNVQANTRHESGVPMNTDERLEREADEIGALRKRVAVNSNVAAGTVQRKIEPQEDEMDDGAWIGAVKGRMNKKYKENFSDEIKACYHRLKRSIYSFTNDEILDQINGTNWYKPGAGKRLAEKMELQKRGGLDYKFGGKGGHTFSKHFDISNENLAARTKGARGIPRASAFAPGVKGKEQALHVLEKLQPRLRALLEEQLCKAGEYVVQEMDQIKGMNVTGAKDHLRRMYDILFDIEIKEVDGEFLISYQFLLKKTGQDFTLSMDYSVEVDRIFQKRVIERDSPGKPKRRYETAHVYRGREKPTIRINPGTTVDEIAELVEQSGIDIVGVTFY